MDDLHTLPTPGQAAPGSARPPRSGRARARLAVILIVLAVAAGAAGEWWLTRNEITTDDAFIDGHAITLAARVAGTVVALAVHDNEFVQPGQVVLRIDPRPYRAAMQAAQARLAEAQALATEATVQLAAIRITAPARLEAARAALAAARADAAKADAEWHRQLRMPRAATTQQAIDTATAAHRAAVAATARARAMLARDDTVADRIAAATALRDERNSEVALARARLATAALDLRWTTLRAPRAGWITKRRVELGNDVQPGQALLALVTPDLWVTANLKETALARLRPGEKVRIDVDAYPGLRLRGHVVSIQRGTGSRFSAFPAENATGNYVKIVQRVPVRIAIDSGLDPRHPLPLGLSVEPVIQVK